MLILLPPSEGKAASGKGKPVDPATLSLPPLHPARAAALDALVTLCRGDADTAAQTLGLTPGLQPEIARNAALPTAAAMPAAALYTGVLYDALDLAGLPAPARRRATRTILIFSGLWGAVRLDDRIPPYRCAMGVKLPGLGTLAAHWKTPMAQAMAETAPTGLILDLRSSAYTPAWTPRADAAARTATVRVLHERPDGSRAVVSHFNKATKGRLVRDLLLDGAAPRTPAQLADALRDLKYTVEQPATPTGRAPQLDVIVNEL
ncbi:peroxide stress protein YaaA [Catellatospora sp. TT07R-123]|uniref:peroxide stress protein YaaA n=1 Tax=Catellatospora sp. TT07R-123 TaxID=2733863 RepID=UPI001BB429EE|nr:peroxide stress protein YaaA [Catellatospora sp. TT07R-123]